MPEIVDPDDDDIYMYFYKGFNDTYMTFEKSNGESKLVMDKKGIPDKLKNKTGRFEFFLKNKGSNKNTYVIMEFSYVVSTKNVTTPLYVETPVLNETQVNETYGPKNEPKKDMVITYFDSKGFKRTRIDKKIDCARMPPNFNDPYYCTKEDKKYMEKRTMRANITDIDIYGMVTVNFTSNLNNDMFLIKKKMDALMSKFRGLKEVDSNSSKEELKSQIVN